MSIGIVKDDLFLEHITDDYHPENPNRLRSIYSMLETISDDNIVFVQPRKATREEIALNHDTAYIDYVASTSGKPAKRLDPDTVTSPKTYEASLLAAGGVLALIDKLQASEIQSAFALVRPPGHHAERDRAMGFCVFNNIAIGARYLEKTYKAKRVLIVDFDLHHGNGTQHSFYRDPTVLYFSTHQYPYYPGTGWHEEIGDGDGKGYTINVPMSYGMSDEDYLYAFQEVLVPVSDIYRPEMVLVSAGFDAYYNDPLGGMTVTEGGYTMMTRMLLEIAKKHSKGRALFALEGGYDLSGLASSVKAVITEMKGDPAYSYGKKKGPSGETIQTVKRLKHLLNPHWGDF